MALSFSRIRIVIICAVGLAVFPAANAQQNDLDARLARAMEAIARAVDSLQSR